MTRLPIYSETADRFLTPVRPSAPTEKWGSAPRFYLRRFTEVVGALSIRNINRFPACPADRLKDPECAKRFRTIAADFIEAARVAE